MKMWKLKSSAKGSQMQTIRVDVANWAPLSWWWPGGCTFILVAPAPCTAPSHPAKQPALSLGQRFFLNSINWKISSSQPQTWIKDAWCLFEFQALILGWHLHFAFFLTNTWVRQAGSEGGRQGQMEYPNLISQFFISWCMIFNIATSLSNTKT